MEGYVGEVREFAGNFAPVGWASCDGQTLDINNYTPLFAIIGTTYGGDSQTHFKLPDWRPTNAQGVKVHGWEIGLPSKIICVEGNFPIRP